MPKILKNRFSTGFSPSFRLFGFSKRQSRGSYRA